jgi:hypothetical protein
MPHAILLARHIQTTGTGIRDQEEDAMQFDAELLLLAMAPVFLACIVWEARHLHRTRREDRVYSWRDTLCNAALALLQQGADKLAWLAIIPVYAFFYDHYRIHTWQTARVSFVLLFAAQDFPGRGISRATGWRERRGAGAGDSRKRI